MDWPWDSQGRQKSSSETKGDTGAEERGVEGTISQIKQKKRSHRDKHRKRNKNKKRDNETRMKNPNQGERQELVKAHCSFSAVSASEHAVSCMKWVLSSWSSKLLSHHAVTAANSKPLAILTYCPPWDHALQKSPFTAHGFVLQLLPKLRCTGTKCCITFCCNILCEITRGLQSRLRLLWIQSCTHRERNVKISKVTEQWHYPFHQQNSWGIPFLLHVRTDHAH